MRGRWSRACTALLGLSLALWSVPAEARASSLRLREPMSVQRVHEVRLLDVGEYRLGAYVVDEHLGGPAHVAEGRRKEARSHDAVSVPPGSRRQRPAPRASVEVHEPGHTPRVVGLTLLGVGASLAASGLASSMLQQSAEDDLAQLCGPSGCDMDELRASELAQRIRRRGDWAGALYGSAAVVSGSGLLIYLIGLLKEDQPSSLSAWCSRSGCSGSYSGRF